MHVNVMKKNGSDILLISIKNYLVSCFYRLKTKVNVDEDFYEEFCFRLCDMESDD